MYSQDERTVTRDCPATAVPSGEPVTIPEGTVVTITHRLGGNFTVLWEMGMARISGTDGDAIDEEVTGLAAGIEDHEGPPDEDAIWKQLRTVFDPEIPVNIVDLGLVYTLNVQEQADNSFAADIKMTLTAPGCGMGPAIAEDARQKVLQVPGVAEAFVDIVWDPPWHQDLISEEGKMQLGLI